VDKRKIANLVVHGLTNKQIALGVGASESYVHELVHNDKEVQTAIAEVAAARNEEEAIKDITIDRIEAGLLSKIYNLIDETTSLGEATTALKNMTAIKADRKAHGIEGEATTKINISVPTNIAVQLNLTVNGDNEIETLSDQVMAPMPTAQVVELVSRGKNSTIQEVILGERGG